MIRVTKYQFIIKNKGYENYQNDHQREIGLELLEVDIGA